MFPTDSRDSISIPRNTKQRDIYFISLQLNVHHVPPLASLFVLSSTYRRHNHRPLSPFSPPFSLPLMNRKLNSEKKSDVNVFHCRRVYADTHIRRARPIDLDDKTRTTTLDIQSRFDNELVFVLTELAHHTTPPPSSPVPFHTALANHPGETRGQIDLRFSTRRTTQLRYLYNSLSRFPLL